jgi:pentatricopeptide repeat protein
MSVSAVDTFIAQTWDVLEKVVLTGQIELIFFVATLALALSIRSSTKKVWGGQVKNRQLSQRTAGGSVQISPKQSTNAVAQLAHDSIAMRCTTSKVLARYGELKASKQLSAIDKDLATAASPYTTFDLFQSLVQCACRGAQPMLVEGLLDDMEQSECARPLEFYESIMRMLAAKKCFKEALAVNDRMEREGLNPSAVTRSCLVSFAAELGMDDKTLFFFSRLCEQTVPSVRACMVVLRVHGKRTDWTSSVELLRGMWDKGVEVDSLLLNIALATGVAAGKADEAEIFLSDPRAKQIADTISYNTVLKGLAQKGRPENAFSLLAVMKQHGIWANIISYNTCIDACVRAKKMDLAWSLYGQLQQIPDLRPDKCTASTLVKALQHRPTSDDVEKVLDLVAEVVAGCPRDLGSRLFTGVMFAAIRLSDLQLAEKTRARIIGHGFALSDDDERALITLQARKAGGQ